MKTDNILGAIPKSIFVTGLITTVISSIIVFFLLLGLKLPEVVSSHAELSSYETPVDVLSSVSGNITKIFVSNGDSVTKGDPIIYIDNYIGENEFQYIYSIAESISFNTDEELITLKAPFVDFRIDPFLEDYILLIEMLIDYQSTYSDHIYLTTLGDYETEIFLLKSQIQLSELESSLTDSLFQFRNEKLRINKKLYDEKVISYIDYLNEVQQQKDAMIRVYNSKNNLVAYKKQLSKLEQDLDSFKNSFSKNRKVAANKIRVKAYKLKSLLDQWKFNHTLKAPKSGKVYFPRRHQEGNFISGESPICTITPSEGEVILTAYVPEVYHGRLSVGLHINLKLDSYPFNDFGSIEAEITDFSDVPNKDGYIEVYGQLMDGLRTNQGYKISPSPRMIGNAEIYISKKSILLKITDNFIKIDDYF